VRHILPSRPVWAGSRQKRRHPHLKGLIIGSIISVIVIPALALVLFAVLIHTTPNTGSPGTGGGGSTAQSGDSSLNLPQESESDSPQTVVSYMNGSNGIYAKAFMAGNSNYLLHYYESTNDGGYSTGTQQIQTGTRIKV
jgi:hypothetical protein